MHVCVPFLGVFIVSWLPRGVVVCITQHTPSCFYNFPVNIFFCLAWLLKVAWSSHNTRNLFKPFNYPPSRRRKKRVGMKPLLPTLKEKKRYVKYQVITASPLRRDVSDELLQRLRRTLGVFGSAEAGLLSIHYDTRTQTGVLRTSVAALPKVRAALLLTTFLSRTRVAIRTLGVSGILKKTDRFKPRMEET